MGSCQSSAIKIVVFDANSRKHVYHFPMKTLRTFQTIENVLNFIDVQLYANDKIYGQNHNGMEEVFPYTKFQIRNLVIRNGQYPRYRIMMEGLY